MVKQGSFVTDRSEAKVVVDGRGSGGRMVGKFNLPGFKGGHEF